jgi:hypothetical protein
MRLAITLAFILLATPSMASPNVPIIEGKLFALCSHLPTQTYWRLFPDDADGEAYTREQQELPPTETSFTIGGRLYPMRPFYWYSLESTCKALREGEADDIQKAFVRQLTF